MSKGDPTVAKRRERTARGKQVPYVPIILQTINMLNNFSVSRLLSFAATLQYDKPNGLPKSKLQNKKPNFSVLKLGNRAFLLLH
ncbi:hypothetical protein V3595_05545 [Bacillus sp. CFBP9009]